jgi:hypothetical protein
MLPVRLNIVQFNAKVNARLKMNKLLKWLTKYWILVSISATIITSLTTWSMHLKSRIDADEDILKDTKEWVASHEDDLQQLHDDVLKLKTLEEAREKGICK